MERFLQALEAARPRVKPKPLSISIDNDPVVLDSDFFEDSSSEDDWGSVDDQELDWLRSVCDDLSTRQPDLYTSDGLFNAISSFISNTACTDEFQVSLVDLLGFDELDIVSQLVQRLESLRGALETQHVGLTESARNKRVQENKLKSQKLAENLQPAHTDPDLPHVYRKHNAGYTLSMFGSKYLLPQGTTNENHGTHQEIIIPAGVADTSFHPKRLLNVSELDKLCKVTFAKYATLNKIQTLVYPVGYETNENMLICAPTGAGKTDVALISILNVIKQHSEFDSENSSYKIDYDAFKIVYVAPLKALAAEIVEKLSTRLSWLGIRVRELTGDMQLTRSEINETQIIVSTPEKWDVVTRKPNDDTGLTTKVKLLVIDEVHLLHEDRGAVIESLVARTLRLVEASQSMIRIVGLSATLPNFVDVAHFLKVNPRQGLFFFDSSFRPCPLEQRLVGVAGKAGSREAMKNLDNIAYDKLVDQLRLGHQVMVFVHSRRDTAKTAEEFKRLALNYGDMELFEAENRDKYTKEMSNYRNRDMAELFSAGFAIHHAGMTRAERNQTEKLFLNNAVKVLCCTATLAWGVNLPAAVVIIKGTQVYNAQKGGFMDLGISDVIQIFGRAGRPQFEKFGTGILCTTRDKLDHYTTQLTNQYPIESRLEKRLADTLNAEISLGTVANVDEGIQWLGYTYLFVRMRLAPLKYGLTMDQVADDPYLGEHRRKLIVEAARRLQEVQMIVFDEDATSSFISKDLGRIASDFYLLNSSVEVFNSALNEQTDIKSVLATIGQSMEFEGIKFRQEEGSELEILENKAKYPISQGVETQEGKTNALLQAYITRINLKETSLISDMNYISQNATRIVRALFLICLSRRWGRLALTMLDLDKALSRRLWPSEHPLFQFELQQPIMRQVREAWPTIDDLKIMSASELGDLVHNHGYGKRLAQYVEKFPQLTLLSSVVRPLTTKVVKIEISLTGNFRWDPSVHGKAQFFWLWVQEDDNKARILHFEKVILRPKTYGDVLTFEFPVPIGEPVPEQLFARIVSDSWLGCETSVSLNFKKLFNQDVQPIQTQLLNLRPLPVGALHNKKLEAYYRKKFDFFNPMQTMCFHSLYHLKTPVLLGSPTGSGKTIASELALFAALRDNPKSKIIYIAPMKALVKERVADWNRGICRALNLKLVELTGDTNPEAHLIRRADILITTPEKFDGVSRNWQTRKFVQEVSLIIMDEVHLLASDRGAILEMIVSRMNFIRNRIGHSVRFLGMSTAIANANDVASWLGVETNEGLFNFPSSVRPVPLEMYIDGFPDNVGFCPLMKSMNKPAFLAIKRHSPEKPALVFVPSRRQTRLTAQDFIHLCGNEDNPRRFLRMSETELANILPEIHDESLKLSLQFGIGVHHAGLVDSDRNYAHKLFAENKIQILIATSTLAWGVNLPAYLVVIKGTQFFDYKIDKYRDMDLTDVLQMMGRAGRPAYDTSGVAMVFTKHSTKSFYKYFLNIGFPVESSLHKYLEDHIGAEISSQTVDSVQTIQEFLKWTFLYRRIQRNPAYYEVEGSFESWLETKVKHCLAELEASKCVVLGPTIEPTPFLRISSFYYLSHKTIRLFLSRAKSDFSVLDCLKCLALATEYDELAIRHNEDLQNEELSNNVPFHGNLLELPMVNPHVKAFLLVQARMRRVGLPIEDYIQDTTTVLDQAIRIMQAHIDVMAELGHFEAVTRIIHLLQCIKQGCEPQDNMVRVLPHLWDTKTKVKLSNVSNKLLQSVSSEHRGALQKVIASLPRPKITSTQIELNPKGHVYCPFFHKPQSESWFVIEENNGVLQSLQRVQKPRTVHASETNTVHVISDTLDLGFKLSPKNTISPGT